MLAYVLFIVSMIIAFVFSTFVSLGLMMVLFTGNNRFMRWYMRRVLKLTEELGELMEETVSPTVVPDDDEW